MQRWFVGGVLLGAALLSSPAGSGADAPVRFHPDPDAIVAAMSRAHRAMLTDEMPAARAALDRIERGCPRYPVEARESFGTKIVNTDRAFHAALSLAREYAGAGESTEAFAAFVDVQTVCRGCHITARREDRWPAADSPDH